MRVFLETERLLLRRFTDSDVANLRPRRRPRGHAFRQRRQTGAPRRDPQRDPAQVPPCLRAFGGVRRLGNHREVERAIRQVDSSFIRGKTPTPVRSARLSTARVRLGQGPPPKGHAR